MEALVDNSEWLSALALSLDNYDACATAFRESVEAAEKKAKAAAAKGGERTCAVVLLDTQHPCPAPLHRPVLCLCLVLDYFWVLFGCFALVNIPSV